MSRPASSPRRVTIAETGELPLVLADEGLEGRAPVVVLVGGAGGMEDHEVESLTRALVEAVVPLLGSHGVLVDGGTDAGVMAAAGRAREAGGARFALVGVAAAGTVEDGEDNDTVGLEPRHSLVLLVPGAHWGDESPWIDAVATAIADGGPSVTLLANGGGIAEVDVQRSLARGRPVVVLAGSGRLADDIAGTPRGSAADVHSDVRIAGFARSDLVTVAHTADSEAVRSAVTEALTPKRKDL